MVHFAGLVFISGCGSDVCDIILPLKLQESSMTAISRYCAVQVKV